MFNGGDPSIQAVLQYSVISASGVASSPPVPVIFTDFAQTQVRLDFGSLPAGEYTIASRLMVGDEEVDRIDSPLRVLDPTLTRRPDQKIQVANGGFSAGGNHVFLQGVNYWPRNHCRR